MVAAKNILSPKIVATYNFSFTWQLPTKPAVAFSPCQVNRKVMWRRFRSKNVPPRLLNNNNARGRWPEVEDVGAKASFRASELKLLRPHPPHAHSPSTLSPLLTQEPWFRGSELVLPNSGGERSERSPDRLYYIIKPY